MEFEGTRWYKCDLHLHTMSSECYIDDDSFDDWIGVVKNNGLNCMVLRQDLAQNKMRSSAG